MAKSIFQDGDTVLVAFGDAINGITLKRGFILKDKNDVNCFIVKTSRGFMNIDDSIGFWKASGKSSARIVLIEKVVDTMSKEDRKWLEDIRLENEQVQLERERLIRQLGERYKNEFGVDYVDYDYIDRNYLW